VVRPAPDLVGRDFTAKAPNRLWVAHIKRIDSDEGPLYLAAVVDCFSRRCVGWSMSEQIDEELVRSALRHALARRRPTSGLIHHSDQGGGGAAGPAGSATAAASTHRGPGEDELP
jgi:putative transposase